MDTIIVLADNFSFPILCMNYFHSDFDVDGVICIVCAFTGFIVERWETGSNLAVAGAKKRSRCM